MNPWGNIQHSTPNIQRAEAVLGAPFARFKAGEQVQRNTELPMIPINPIIQPLDSSPVLFDAAIQLV